MALFIFVLSISEFSHALYGGRTLPARSELDAIVSLHLSDPYEPQYDFFCSGVLIAPDKVLTTGHCIDVMASEVYSMWNIFAYEPELIKVKIAGVKYPVADVIFAPTYFEAPGFEGEDLAIVKLQKAVTSIRPMKFASRASLKVNQPVTLVARGQIAETTISALKTYGKHLVIESNGSRAGICAGDSGGALLIKNAKEYQLAGILSSPDEGCEKRTGVSIFARPF